MTKLDPADPGMRFDLQVESPVILITPYCAPGDGVLLLKIATLF